MKIGRISVTTDQLPGFDRDFFGSDKVISYIGYGSIGGKASGLAFIKDVLKEHFSNQDFPGISLRIPRLVVLATGFFERFIEYNKLYDAFDPEISDDRIAHAFQKAQFPPEFVGDIRALISGVKTPLAIRSSSLLEDAMYEPFAGVYGTKMIPNNQPDIDTRFRKLIEAIKFVYASVFFKGARDYITITGRSYQEEKMAVIIQEIAGQRYNDRFYPNISGVARSYNFYPIGKARPKDGVIDLALGLGKTIVDGGLIWSYSPAYPKLSPPVGSAGKLVKLTQAEFWAVNMGQPPAYDPVRETEYMIKGNLPEAEYDNTLKYIASTYRPQDDRLVPGIGADGPRVLTFAPILQDRLLPLNNLLKKLLKVCKEAIGTPIEMEFAVTLDPKNGIPARFDFLQVRPMVVSDESVDVNVDEMIGENVLVASERTLGNGIVDDLVDVVYVRPDKFEARYTGQIAGELEKINRQLVMEDRKYLLLGFGRWGSSDPWLGIPVEWSQISGAGAIVEATLQDMDIELSQGSHFFHNLTSFEICYLAVHHTGAYKIDWSWLAGQNEIVATELVSHVRLKRPVTIRVDGQTKRGVILK